MNKMLIVLLAVCLVSVSAFVKRDTPAAPENNEGLASFQKQAKEIGDEFLKALDPENFKKKFNEAVDGVSKTVKDFMDKQQTANAAKKTD